MRIKGWIGLTLFLLIALFALIGPYLNEFSYEQMILENKNLAPSLTYWFGSDDLGRDLFTRVAYGTRISLTVGICAATIDIMIGILWGSIAAFSGRTCDTVMMRIADALYAIPYMLMVIVVMMIIGQGFLSILIAMTITGWITMARIIRGQILMLKEQEFVLASRALGGKFWHIFVHHLIPNTSSIILVTLMLTIPSAIFTEAFIGFLGMSGSISFPSLGTMVNESLPALLYYPWRLFFPAGTICLTMLSLQLVGEEFGRNKRLNYDSP